MADETSLIKCVTCGGYIKEDHEAEKVGGNSLAHAACQRDPTGAKTDRSYLDEFAEGDDGE